MESRIHLRPLRPEDSAAMLEWMRDEGVTRFLNIGGPDTQLETVQRFIAGAQDETENLHRAIADEQDAYLGTVSLKHIQREQGEAEYAIAMHPKGIGTGASMTGSLQILDYAFQTLGLQRVYLCVRPENVRAVRFYQKCGWVSCDPPAGDAEQEMLWFEKNART